MTKGLVALALLALASAAQASPGTPVEILPGVWRITFGAPEKITPVSTRHYAPAAEALAALPPVDACPIAVDGHAQDRGFIVSLPLAPDEMVYGLGLQLHSFQQRGLKKTLRVNADATLDTGDTNAPVPFYVTTRGYGVYVDTARYATFYLGNKRPQPDPQAEVPKEGNDDWNGHMSQTKRLGLDRTSEVLVDVPTARGVDVYVFAGPTLRLAVQRYNLFSGGGPLPPRWGLGFWYRGDSDYSQKDVLGLAAELRDRRIPCDVLGLEPHWQSHAYSCSYVWAKTFPDPKEMLDQLSREHYRVNLWEHPFVHPSSPLYPALLSHAGNYQVWGGLVPDFLQPETRRIFADFHEREHVAIGVSGYKLDECDNSDFTGNWSFPELSQFPSGADGEQMHSLFGLRYQDTLQSIFEKRQQRTYGLVRSSQALAAPSPYVLYSDLYSHQQFVHAVAQAGFSGLLWTPEVRDAPGGPEELIRRLESVAFSPLAMINAWYLRNPPWKQVERSANNAGRFSPGWEQVEAQCRTIIELRMRFIPYLHAAFVRYHREGLPPFRALVMDYPDDPRVRMIDDEYLMGDSVLVAPVIVPDSDRTGAAHDFRNSRSVYLPAGDWYDYWTGQRYSGRQHLTVAAPLGRIPLFVKAGAILPLAQPTLDTDDPASWQLTARVFGDGTAGATLFEDDGSFAPALPEVRLSWNSSTGSGQLARSGPAGPARYAVVEWQRTP